MTEQKLMWIEIKSPDGEILLEDAQLMARTKQDPRIDQDTLYIWANSEEEAQFIVGKIKENAWIQRDYRARIVTDQEHKTGGPEKPDDAGKAWWRNNYPIAIPSHTARRARAKREKEA